METTHRALVGDSRRLSGLDDGAADLVITSPPYPMIEMWDDVFADLDPGVADCLAAGRGREAFERMHAVLDQTWAEVDRVLADGGVACINVGDATRTVDGDFAQYPNHARVTDWFTDHGFRALPDVLWRKPANSAAKFMGSGMLPPNAYVTLEHEYVLVFRKGGPRAFAPGADRRYEAAYFWEERNRWFSDLWTDVRGTAQTLDGHEDARERSAAFPLEIPYRLVNMYSVYGDTVLDPFWGTGTTSLAAMIAGRNSVGCELDADLRAVFDDRVGDAPALSREVVGDRLDRHAAFVAERREAGQEPDYVATHYDVPVVTSQETDLRFRVVDDVRRDGDAYVATHSPYEWSPDGSRGGDAAPAADG